MKNKNNFKVSFILAFILLVLIQSSVHQTDLHILFFAMFSVYPLPIVFAFIEDNRFKRFIAAWILFFIVFVPILCFLALISIDIAANLQHWPNQITVLLSGFSLGMMRFFDTNTSLRKLN